MRLPLFALAFAGMSCNLIAGESTVGCPSTVGYRSHPFTIDEAVQLALKQNPSILQQIQQLKVQKGLFYQAQAKLLPQLTANSNYSQTDTALNPLGWCRADRQIDLLAVPSSGPNAGTLNVSLRSRTTAITMPSRFQPQPYRPARQSKPGRSH